MVIVNDSQGRRFEPGVRVMLYGYKPGRDNPSEFFGVVTAVSEPDGDVNEHGRPVAISPKVTVRFDDGCLDSFGTRWTARWYTEEDAPWECDDVDVVAHGEAALFEFG